MRILITGASGLLGVNLALEGVKDHTVYGQINALPLKNAPFTQLSGDLLEKDAAAKLIDSVEPDWVIHCAALADIDACEKEPDFARKLNADLPGEFARACKNRSKLVYISTDAVFDGTKEEYSEDDAPNPLSTYARTKLDGERAVMEIDPNAIVTRINLFGWSLFGTRSLAEWFFYNLQAGRTVKGFTDVFFCTQLANDLANVLFEMCSLNLAGLYHAVGADCISKYDFALMFAKELGVSSEMVQPVKVNEFGLNAARSSNLRLSTARLQKDIHIPVPRLSTGLERFFKQYQQGYPHFLRKMVDNQGSNINPYADGGNNGI